MDMYDDQATVDDFYNFGFKPLTHFTIGEQCKLELSRRRYLSAMCIGQGNETVWLGCKDRGGEITDLICVHNRDYDGFITYGRLKEMVNYFEEMK